MLGVPPKLSLSRSRRGGHDHPDRPTAELDVGDVLVLPASHFLLTESRYPSLSHFANFALIRVGSWTQSWVRRAAQYALLHNTLPIQAGADRVLMAATLAPALRRSWVKGPGITILHATAMTMPSIASSIVQGWFCDQPDDCSNFSV